MMKNKTNKKKMQKKYIKVSSNFFYELASLSRDVEICYIGKNILVPFCQRNTLLIPKFQNKADCISQIFVTDFTLVTKFYL